MSGKMLLMLDTTIAHYKITSKLGQGGMGEVYRAIDTKLDREVAVKVLPESFAQDKERLARFEREAKSLASLNHPNIAGIFGLERTGHSQALILELVEGEDLSARLKRGPLPIDEVIELGKQIAEALEAAHEKGIVHRDLKPGNIKLTSDGMVKVLDFGLAKAMTDGPDSASFSGNSQDESPTLTADYTLPGVVLGTAGYMSPEQAKGKSIDERSDIWSFGVVLFECLSGRRLFDGESVTDSIGALLHKEPDWNALPEETPAILRLLLKKCLSKDRKRRLHHIADARVDLEQAMADPTSSFIGLTDSAINASHAKGLSSNLVTGLVLLAMIVTAALTWFFKPETESSITQKDRSGHFGIHLDLEQHLAGAGSAAARFSPDGSKIAYMVGKHYPQYAKLYIRSLDGLVATELTNAFGVVDFCFDPTGRWIAFRKGGTDILKKISTSGGPAVDIADVGSSTWGIDWTEDGTIVFADDEKGVLRRLSSQGGQAIEDLSSRATEDFIPCFPQVLPGAEAVLFTAIKARSGDIDEATIMIKRLPNGEEKVLKTGGFGARYLPSGHLVYMHRGTLFGAAFDLSALDITGETLPLPYGVAYNEAGSAHFDVSSQGDLIYLKGGVIQELYELRWAGGVGGSEQFMPPDTYMGFRVSPDGSKLAYGIQQNDKRTIYIHDLERNLSTPLTSDPPLGSAPIWSPNSDAIIFRSIRNGQGALYWKGLGDRRSPMPVTEFGIRQFPLSWRRDTNGNQLVVLEAGSDRNQGTVRVLELIGDAQSGWTATDSESSLKIPLVGPNASLSPDGQWLAFSGRIDGNWQIWVCQFPSGNHLQRVSVEGILFQEPSWGPDQMLTYMCLLEVNRAYQLFKTKWSVQKDIIEFETPQLWNGVSGKWTYRGNLYDLDKEGQRALVRNPGTNIDDKNFKQVYIKQGFLTELEEMIPKQGE